MGCALLPDETKERLGCGKHQFPNRDRRQASPLASPQQPMDHVFLRGLNPPKRCRPLLSKVDLNGSRFYGNRRKTYPRWFFKKEADLQPHRVRAWLTPAPDPAFQARCADICEV